MKRRAAPAAGAAARASGFSSPALARSLRKLIGPLGGSRLCVAYSGGLDSTALLAACAALRVRYRCQVRAVHVNHHLQPAADAMAAAARRAARKLGLTCRVVSAPVAVARGESLEAAARLRRRAALRRELREGEWLLLAQHQDDQVEALLLQLLRGAGIAGLAAMAPRSQSVLRPLLEVRREQLQRYLRRRSLPWTEDPSNADERFARNYLRRQVLPLLRERWPGLAAAIGRSAALAAEAQQLLSARAAAQLQDAHAGASLRVVALRRLPDLDRRNALRYWLEGRGVTMPDQRRLREIAGPMLQARHDAQPEVRWQGGSVRRHGGLLYAAPGAASPVPERKPLSWHWRAAPRLALPGVGCLELRDDPHGPWLRDSLPERVTVAFRHPEGAIAGLPGAHRLKRELQAGAVPPWRRTAVPLVYAGARLLAIGDWWCAPQRRNGPPARRARRCRLHLRHEAPAFI